MEHASNRADVPFFPLHSSFGTGQVDLRVERGTMYGLQPLPSRGLAIQEQSMIDKDRIKGSAEQAKGKVKEFAGKVSGDEKTETEGKADQVKGKVQNTVGGIKDAVRGK
jgi:uncharacterized protein YjbJ (UPF0337 family)